jgi:RNA polymerase sigma factor (sigma-70 family)
MEFEDAVTLFRPVVYRYCRRFLRDGDRAEDATQEVFVRAMDLWHGKVFEDDEHIRAWLLTIARFRCLNDARSASRTIPLSVYEKMPSGSIRGPGGNPYVEREVLSRLEWENVRALLDKFDDDRRNVLLLNAEGFHDMEICRALHLPYDDVISHLRHGPAAVRALADEEWIAWITEKYLRTKSTEH